MAGRRQSDKKPQSDDPHAIANASGFAFQLAVQEAVTRSQNHHGWRVESREHGWREGETPRFIDLILRKFTLRLVIECKRPRGGRWVFLVPDPLDGRPAEERAWFRTPYLRNENSGFDRRCVYSLENFHVHPLSWESAFCATHGTTDDQAPFLDRLCGALTRSADAVAAQQRLLDAGTPAPPSNLPLKHGPHIFVPLIATTAELHVCRFDPSHVPLDRGEIPPESTWQEVEHVRYRKSFAAPTGGSALGANLTDLEAATQQTVLIVRARHLTDWLAEFKLQRADY